MTTETTVADLSANLRLKPDRGSFAAGDRLIGGLKAAVGGLAALAGVNWLENTISGTIAAADNIDELSQRSDVSAESLQALGHAAKFSSLGVEDLNGGLGFLAKNAEKAARGNKGAAKAFRDVGIDAKSLLDGTLSAEDAIGAISKKMSAMPAGARKTALSMALLGKSGSKWIPFLNEGPEGLKRLTDEAREMGIVLDNEAIKAMARFADTGTSIGGVMTGLKNELVLALLPALQMVADAVLPWLKNNRKLIAQRLTSVFKAIGGALQVVAAIVGRLVTGFTWLADKLSLTGEAVGVLIGSLFAFTKIAGLAGGALGAGFGSAALPLVLIGTLVAGLIMLLKDVSFEDVKKKAAEFLSWARDQAEELLDKHVVAPVKHLVDNPTSTAVGMAEGVEEGVRGIFGGGTGRLKVDPGSIRRSFGDQAPALTAQQQAEGVIHDVLGALATAQSQQNQAANVSKTVTQNISINVQNAINEAELAERIKRESIDAMKDAME